MKKEEKECFGTAFNFCYERAVENVAKNMGVEKEKVDHCETSIFKRFCKMHPNLEIEHWENIKLKSTLFTRRIEYMLACYHI